LEHFSESFSTTLKNRFITLLHCWARSRSHFRSLLCFF
jgi:hypothetical protein